MELVQLKLKKGKRYGTPAMDDESVFQALDRAGKQGNEYYSWWVKSPKKQSERVRFC